jgi:hypothetical protein
MPIHRSAWHRLTPKNNLPALPCPRCVTGKLKLRPNGLTSYEPKYVADWRDQNPDDWEHDFATERWSASMRCDEAACGEVVHMIGDIEVVETDVPLPGGQSTWGYQDVVNAG